MAIDPPVRQSQGDAGAGVLITSEQGTSDAWGEGRHAPAIGPWKLAWRRLRRNKLSMGFAVLFLVLVAICILAPVYSHDIAHIGPNAENVTGTVNVGGKQENIVSLSGVPIGPTFTS